MADVARNKNDAATRRGVPLHREPRAATVRFDTGTRRVIVELTNGCTFAFPVAPV